MLCRQGSQHGTVDHRPGLGQKLPPGHVLSPQDYIFPRGKGCKDFHGFSAELRVLILSHRIGSRRDGGPGENLGGGSRRDLSGPHGAGRNLLQNFQGHRVLPAGLPGVLPPKGVAVKGASVKGRHVLRRIDRLGQDPSPGLNQRHSLHIVQRLYLPQQQCSGRTILHIAVHFASLPGRKNNGPTPPLQSSPSHWNSLLFKSGRSAGFPAGPLTQGQGRSGMAFGFSRCGSEIFL